MSDILLTSWKTLVKLDEKSNGSITNIARGKVNTGRLRDKDMSFFTDANTVFSDLNLVIKDLNTAEKIVPEVLLDGPKYIRIKFPFKYPIDAGEEFGFEARYILPAAFKLGGDDFYSQILRHNVVSFSLSVEFPAKLKVTDIAGSTLKTSGGILVDLKPDEMPVIIKEQDHQLIRWDMMYARLGYNFTINWKTEWE